MAYERFITNSNNKTLGGRLRSLVKLSSEMKFLSGFFYFSGWREIYEPLKGNSDAKLKILVGLEVEKHLGATIEIACSDIRRSRADAAESYLKSVKNALNSAQVDVEEFYEQAKFFIELIEQGRLEIRKALDPCHAKLYIFRVHDDLKELREGTIVTGSSNLTRSGMSGQHEFNVEISDYGFDEAENFFDELWRRSVPITEDEDLRRRLLDYIGDCSQLAEVTPFEAYVKVLREYLDIQYIRELQPGVERLLRDRGYIKMSYQLDAVRQALSVIDNYGGVILADVVGLGKSIIASLVGKSLMRRGMIICPPGLIGEEDGASGWRKYAHDFKLYDWVVRSTGQLERCIEYLERYGDDIDVVVIDEAHRFRNQDTESYEMLSRICRGRKVILLTATPFNNSPADIFSLLKLFVVVGKSKITIDENLEALFQSYEGQFNRLSYILKYHNSKNESKKSKAETYYSEFFDGPIRTWRVRAKLKDISENIREVIEPVVIRRNRLDLKNDPVYSSEITGLSEVDRPERLYYELSREQSEFYDEVIYEYFGAESSFKGAIYQPFSYREGIAGDDNTELDQDTEFTFQSQRNTYDFMRRLLVKRFESSFGSFCKSIDNFIRTHEAALDFIETSGKYVLDRAFVDKISGQDAEEIEEALEEFAEKLASRDGVKGEVYVVSEFKDEDKFLEDINADLELLKKIRIRVEQLKLREDDPKVVSLIEELEQMLAHKPAPGEPERKVIVFTEYVDTVRHVAKYLHGAFEKRVLVVDGRLGHRRYKKLLENFDASVEDKRQKDDFDILLTSDKLSEGFNLNRAGTIINYDIPWNPTRVIQRVGRINRIGKKVFDVLKIFNFFPTEQGADIVKSEEIAGQKMLMIHNVLGEDARIFDAEEEPQAAELFRRINQNPEDDQEESLLTSIRRELAEIEERYPKVMVRVRRLANRIKTSKKAGDNGLTVFSRKGLAMFIQRAAIKDDKADNKTISIAEGLDLIRCGKDEPRVELSGDFWQMYEDVKKPARGARMRRSERSLEARACNNIQSALQHHREALVLYEDFLQDIIIDMRDYRTLPKYTLRRLAEVNLEPGNVDGVEDLKKTLDKLINMLGTDFLDKVKQRAGDVTREVIVAVEDIKR